MIDLAQITQHGVEIRVKMPSRTTKPEWEATPLVTKSVELVYCVIWV